MGNKMKKMLCALLASAMLVTSMGAVSFAAPDDDTAAETTVTETAAGDSSTADQSDEEKETADADTATEATEAPAAEATAAPAVTSSSTDYDNDDYYKKALALCSSLGIISGFEDGSVRPDSDVTRAQMASIVLRMLALDGTSQYKGIFSDMTDAHWAASQVQSAYEAKIINGFTDGTFRPDEQVTYAQVIVMLVNAMNYREDAEYYGGWQQGYIKEAGDIGLLKNAPGSADTASDRGTVIKMVYNALLGDYKEVRTYDAYGQPEYSTDKTLAEVKFDVIEAKGMLVGTSKTSLRGDVQDGQLVIDKKDGKDVQEEVYDTVLTGLEDYIGQSVTYYYRDNNGKASEVLAVTYDSSKSESYEINDLDDIDTVKLNADGSLAIKIKKVSKEKTASADANYIYNGKLVTASDLDGKTVKDLIENIEKGSVKMVKSDKSLSDYDIVFIDEYITMVVTSSNDTKLIGKIQDPEKAVGETKAQTITLDDTKTRTITVTKAGQEIRLRNLKKNDVASVRASLPISNPEVIDVIVSGESITGSAASISSLQLNDTYATINGDQYDIANVAAKDVKTGTQSTFYLDAFGRVGRVESSSSGRLEAGEKYGWVLQQYKAEGSSDQVLKIMTQDGVVEYPYATNVDYWAPGALVGADDAGVSLSKTTIEGLVKTLFDDDKFQHRWKDERQSTGSATHFDRPHKISQGESIRLVKFKTNASGKITKLYFAVNYVNLSKYFYADGGDSTDVYGTQMITDKYLTDDQIAALKDSDALIFDQTSKSGSVLVGGLLGGYSLTDDCIEFDVPNDVAKYTNETSYSVANVVSSRYNVRENGVSDTYLFADADGTTPAVLIKFVNDPDSAAVATDMGTASSISMMVVDKINSAYNKEEDKIVYKVVGYTAGGEVSFTTMTTSALSDVTGIQSSGDKKYVGTAVWDAKSGGLVNVEGTDSKSDSLADYLHEGDVIIQEGDKILRLVDSHKVYENKGLAANAWTAGSDSRVKYFFGPVTDSDIGDVSWFVVNGQTISMDDSGVMDLVEIDLASDNVDSAVKLSDELVSVSDLEKYSDAATNKEYDIAFVRIAPKGALGEVVVFRIKNPTIAQ